tara:strand:- start:491 stop:709 length:219 start_codon:yes stop_codon:yes gene_type:complete
MATRHTIFTTRHIRRRRSNELDFYSFYFPSPISIQYALYVVGYHGLPDNAMNKSDASSLSAGAHSGSSNNDQ